ncbi:putative ribonuclease H-like domain-containing protein [Tanacetum coccineum]
MAFESTNSSTTAKLPILKLGEYEMWVGYKDLCCTSNPRLCTLGGDRQMVDSWVVMVMILMALPNEHQLTFSQYPNAKSMFAAIETRFGGNAATKKTQKTLLKQQYENFSATSAESLDSIFNRLQKIVSRLAILGVVIAQEDLNSKFLCCLPTEWKKHHVVKKSVGASSGAQNLAFMTAPSTSSTNDTNTASPQVSDNTVYAFMVKNPNGSNVLHQDLEKIHEDDLEAMDLKWQLSLLSVRAKKECIRTEAGKVLIGGDMAEEQVLKKNIGYNGFSDSRGSQIIDKCKKGLGYSAVPPPHSLIYNRPNKHDLSYSGLDEFKRSEFKGYCPENSEQESNVVCDKKSDNSKENSEESLVAKQVSQGTSSFVESSPKVDKETVFPINKKVEFTKPKNHEKLVKKSVRYAEIYRSQSPRGNQRNWNRQKSNQLGKDFMMYNKACFICGSFNHLQINCDNHQRRGIVSRNNYSRVDAKTTHPSVHRNMSPKAVLLKTGLTPLNTVRPVNTAHPKTAVHSAKSKTHFSKQAQSTAKRPFYKKTRLTNRYFHQKVNTVRPRVVNTARPYTTPVNTVRGKPQHDDKGFVDSGCSRHMTGNIAYLLDFKEFDGGYVAFGGGAYGGRITGKGILKTDNLDFEDVYFVNELKFNLFSVSQMCDKKNYVLFTDTECLVLSPNFKLPDENQILLKIPRKDNMYSFDMKNIVPKESLTCLVAKATLDESMLWHRRLGHINFKNINKLVKDNLVRGLPTKRFENDQTCVACLKRKQNRASCKSKVLNLITKPLFMLHIDLFGPTFVTSLMHKKYCLIVTDDYSRFTSLGFPF